MRRTDTIPAYREFLERFPEGSRAEAAEQRLQILSEAVRALKSVDIVIDEAYTFGRAGTEIEDVHLPLRGTAAVLLRHVPLAVDGDPASGRHGVLHLRLRGRALSRSYAPANERRLASTEAATRQYAGASLRGSIRLQTAAGTVYERDFAGLESPPGRLGAASFSRPRDAPFPSAFEDHVVPELCCMIGELFGARPLVRVLERESNVLGTAAARALGELGDSTATGPLLRALQATANFELKGALVVALGRLGDARAIEPLIEVLDDAFDASLREDAAEALRALTGADHGDDARAWRAWWERSGPR